MGVLVFTLIATDPGSLWFKKVKCLFPVDVQANPELTAIWAVGQRIWQRDFPGIYTAIATFQWSENILPVMEALRGTSEISSNFAIFKI